MDMNYMPPEAVLVHCQGGGNQDVTIRIDLTYLPRALWKSPFLRKPFSILPSFIILSYLLCCTIVALIVMAFKPLIIGMVWCSEESFEARQNWVLTSV